MYEGEYRELVLEDFEQRWKAGILPPELIAPTRKSLRDHSIRVCTERYEKKDEPLLESFFGKRDNQAAYIIAVKNTDAEDFRTLNNFLKDRKKGTSSKNIYMLAWMIDFEPRPFHEDLERPVKPVAEPERISELIHPPQPGTQEPFQLTDGENPVDEPPEDTLSSDNSGAKKSWAYAIALLLVSLTAYYFFSHPDSSGACMIWTGEKYQQVACSHKSEDGAISTVPLDTAVLRHFKKIMQEDTLTANAIGKVFCVKVNGKYEYYTDSAANPVYPEKPLRPLTKYIMNNNP